MIRTPLLLAGLLAGCAHPVHLQYDYGRAFETALTTQADLGRASVAKSNYPLSGFEGIELRARATEEATDAETGESQFIDSFKVE